MRKTMLGLAVGGLALVGCQDAASSAEACVRMGPGVGSGPHMANLVRGAHTIELAHVSSAIPLSESEVQHYPSHMTHEYTFVVETTLKGPQEDRFTYRASIPFPPVEPAGCVGLERSWPADHGSLMMSCLQYDQGRLGYERANDLAQSGHEDWRSFFHISDYVRNGVGGIPASGLPGVGCDWAESYEPDQSYLAFRNADGEVIFTYGLNLQPVIRSDDAWLIAVRHFLANPDANALPPIDNRTYFRGHDTYVVFETSSCSIGENTSYQAALEVVGSSFRRNLQAGDDAQFFNVPTAHEGLSDCDVGDQYLFVITDILPHHPLPPFFPIRDGMVDLSGIPSQYRIEPSEVPLEDVISWLSELPQ